jgi:hypothetical protein
MSMIVLVIALTLGVSSTAGAADFDKGIDAFSSGDYTT